MTRLEERKTAIHLLRTGQSVQAVATELGRTPRWVRKWRRRYQRAGWAGLQGRSRRPSRLARQIPGSHHQAIRQTRSELEAEAATGQGLKYVGGPAIRTRLQEQGLHPLPSVATIERVLRAAGLTRPYQRVPPPAIHYPKVTVSQPQTLIQVDIVPQYLKGGARVACFNAIDVVSRYPTGQAYARRRSLEAAAFLLQVWQELGVPHYTQVDNEGCFSGGATHPYVLGKVVRLALQVGTELIFSPVRHPQSNGFVERFHRDYKQHVWQDTYLDSLPAVQAQAARFFALYRQRPHPQLQDQTPSQVHGGPRQPPEPGLALTRQRPVYAGQVHFMRAVSADHTISVLNVPWAVPTAQPQQGVWATVDLQPQGTVLRIFDQAPDGPQRHQLACHSFPVSAPVLAHPRRAPRPAPSVFSAALQFVNRWATQWLGGTMS